VKEKKEHKSNGEEERKENTKEREKVKPI